MGRKQIKIWENEDKIGGGGGVKLSMHDYCGN